MIGATRPYGQWFDLTLVPPRKEPIALLVTYILTCQNNCKTRDVGWRLAKAQVDDLPPYKAQDMGQGPIRPL